MLQPRKNTVIPQSYFSAEPTKIYIFFQHTSLSLGLNLIPSPLQENIPV